MIRPEKREVESIAANCATGLERAWAENDRLQAFADQLAGEKFSDRNHAALRSRASIAEAQLADCCPELTARKCALLGLFVLGVCL